MSRPARFLQIHTLTGYSAALLNRDDAGYAKRIEYGGAVRTRVSSQCLKRHWRTADDEWSLSGIGLDMTVRSRRTFDRCVVEPLVASGLPAEAVTAAMTVFMAALFKESEKAKAKRGETTPTDFHTGQVVVLGRPEINYVRDEIAAIARQTADAKSAEAVAAERVKVLKDNITALRTGAGLDAAMFGRMVTSDVLARKTAAVHVAHAFTVHKEESESDYFTAVDDLITGIEDTGSGHLGQSELTSGLYYGYVVVDMPTLVSNIEGCAPADWLKADHATAARTVEHLLHLIATVSPGAKQGSTAPYAYARLVLLETGSRQPRSLAGAFHTPVKPGRDGLVPAALAALREHLDEIDTDYGCAERRWQTGGGKAAPLPAAERMPFDQAVAAALAALGS